jgi:hypothetical protein
MNADDVVAPTSTDGETVADHTPCGKESLSRFLATCFEMSG